MPRVLSRICSCLLKATPCQPIPTISSSSPPYISASGDADTFGAKRLLEDPDICEFRSGTVSNYYMVESSVVDAYVIIDNQFRTFITRIHIRNAQNKSARE